MIYAATGHRPHRIGSDDLPVKSLLYKFAIGVLRTLRPSETIVGMAQGWDTAVAAASRFLDIPYVAAIPYKGYGASWDDKDKRIYHDLVKDAKEVVFVSEVYSRKVFANRDKWMVDRGDQVLALFDGNQYGGTWLTIDYAHEMEKSVLNVWDDWLDYIGRK